MEFEQLDYDTTITQESLDAVYGGAEKKQKKTVVRKEIIAGSTRNVYKVEGRGNALFVTIQGKEMRYVEAKKQDTPKKTKKPTDAMQKKADAMVQKLKKETLAKVRAKRTEAEKAKKAEKREKEAGKKALALEKEAAKKALALEKEAAKKALAHEKAAAKKALDLQKMNAKADAMVEKLRNQAIKKARAAAKAKANKA
jgi:hypothetical protein